VKRRYEVNEPDVSGEILDGELILVDFASGCYFSCQGSGAVLWDFMSSGLSGEEMVATLAERYVSTTEELSKTVRDFLDELTSNGLIKQTAASLSSASQTPAALAPEEGKESAKLPFCAPTLERFSDMQEMLLLDPIHEVDKTGWPAPMQEEK